MTPGTKYTIWDPVVRIFHWLVAMLFLANYWLLEAGEDWHEIVGYAVAAVLAIRLIWGFCGSKYARFSDFFPTPARLKTYVQQPETRHPMAGGHNPLGALMILLMMFLLALVTLNGWLQETDRYWGVEWPQVLHEWSADVLMAAVVVHVVTVLWIQKKTGVPLVKPMITGVRNSSKEADNADTH